MMKPSLVLLLALVLLISSVPLTASQPSLPDDRVASATSATIELSRSRENGDRFDLYDRMHPDARNLFPRLAFFTWLDAGGLPPPADDPEILDVRIGPWTSPLTGETYDDAAAVTYRQVEVRAGIPTTVEATLLLVADGLRWRWFPDIDSATLTSARAAAEATPVSAGEGLRRAAWVRIDRFWAGVFAAAGRDYASPRLVEVVQAPVQTGCGLETDIALRSIYYCLADTTIYYDPQFEETVEDLAGGYAMTMVVSHEWAHHIQVLVDIELSFDPELDGGLYPIELELQADCLAGVYAQDALANGDVGWDQIDSAIQVTASAGDRIGTNWDDWNAHGTSRQRVESFQTGFEDGFWGCYLDLDADHAD
jgi:predicted metalloprotease